MSLFSPITAVPGYVERFRYSRLVTVSADNPFCLHICLEVDKISIDCIWSSRHFVCTKLVSEFT